MSDMQHMSRVHPGAPVNPKHVASLVRFFESGIKPQHSDGYGVEIEHLPVRNGTDVAVTYAEPNGVEQLLEGLRPYFDKNKEFVEDGHLLGLARDHITISLEPGGQVETSIGVLRNPHELRALYAQFRAQADPVLEWLGFRLINYGYQPVSTCESIAIHPKRRYAAMDEYFGRIGQFGRNMMRCSASTQVSIDYLGESDAIAKMRVGTAIAPIIAYFFRNTPYFEGSPSPYPLMRQHIWDNADPERTGITPGLYRKDFGWADYAADVLATPMMFVDLTHTPEAATLSEDEQERVAFRSNAAEVYPDRELNAYEVSHVLSTHFNDVRLKNFVELRPWDSLPIERAERLTEAVGDIFYDQSRFGALCRFFDGITEEDVRAAKADLQVRAAAATPYGQSMDWWQTALGLLKDTLADVPGDPVHPDVFQA